jgi:ankyrin repeat protein
VRVLLEYRADVDAKDEYGRTALHRAAGKGHNAVVPLLEPQTKSR